MAAEDEIIKNRAAANRMLLIEAITVGLCGLLFYVLISLEFTVSVILGGLAFILPNMIFVWFSLRISKTGSSGSTLAWFYVGEAIKIITTIVIFTVSFIYVTPLNIGLMFVSYGALLLMNLTGLAMLTIKN